MTRLSTVNASVMNSRQPPIDPKKGREASTAQHNGSEQRWPMHSASEADAATVLIPQSSSSPRAPVTRISARSERKRTSSANSRVQSKRCRTSDVSDGIPFHKRSACRECTSPEHQLTEKCDQIYDLSNKASMARACGTNFQVKQKRTANGFAGPLRPNPVFALNTSMSALSSASQLTTLEAVRASTGHGTNVYDGTMSAGNTSNVKTFQQLCVDRRADAATKSTLSDSQNLSPHIADSTQIPRVWPIEEGNKFDPTDSAMHVSLDKSVKVIPNGPKTKCAPERLEELYKPCPANGVTADLDEDFIGNDEAFDKALDIIDTATPVEKLLLTKAPSKKKTNKLPTSANADSQFEAMSKASLYFANNIEEKEFEDDFIGSSDENDDAELIVLMEYAETDASKISPVLPSRQSPNSYRADKLCHSEGDASSEGNILFSGKTREIPSTPTQDFIKPIVRKHFPEPVLDRSPIFGITNSTVLRTCIRVGEAFQVGSQAVRSNKFVIIELYARAASSWRESKPSRKQHFVFKDLYHDKPPHLNGTFELWDQSYVWDHDSALFLGSRKDGIICRVIAKMKREAERWKLEVLNIKEASWEDVTFVAGIYGADD